MSCLHWTYDHDPATGEIRLAILDNVPGLSVEIQVQPDDHGYIVTVIAESSTSGPNVSTQHCDDYSSALDELHKSQALWDE